MIRIRQGMTRFYEAHGSVRLLAVYGIAAALLAVAGGLGFASRYVDGVVLGVLIGALVGGAGVYLYIKEGHDARR